MKRGVLNEPGIGSRSAGGTLDREQREEALNAAAREYGMRRPRRRPIAVGSAFSIVGAALILFYGLVRNPFAVNLLIAAIVGLLVLLLLATAARWVWEDRRRRRGVERMVGPEGRSYLPFASTPGRDRASLGPAFNLGRPRVRKPHHNGRRSRA